MTFCLRNITGVMLQFQNEPGKPSLTSAEMPLPVAFKFQYALSMPLVAL
jgi:hypothetical protein